MLKAHFKRMGDKLGEVGRSLLPSTSAGDRDCWPTTDLRDAPGTDAGSRSVHALSAELLRAANATLDFARAWPAAAQAAAELRRINDGDVDTGEYLRATGCAAAIRSNYNRAAAALQRLITASRSANVYWQITLAEVGPDVSDPEAAAAEVRRAWEDHGDSVLDALQWWPGERKEIERIVSASLKKGLPDPVGVTDTLIAKSALKRMEKLRDTLTESAKATEAITLFP